MGVKFANKFSTTLSAGINNSVTSLSIASATGFPTISGGHHAYVTLDNGDGTTVEVVKVTNISGTTLTVTRAQDSTSAAAFSAGAKVEIRMTSALLQDVKDEGPDDTVLKVDQGNNRVGILNTSPDVSLDVGSATDSMHIPVGTTAQRPGSPAAGYFRFNSTETQFEGYDGSGWGEIGGGGATLAVDNFTGDGSDTTFTMGAAPETENNTQVYIDGVYQQKNTYSISGTTLTFSEAPPNTSSVEVVRISAATVSVGTPDDNTVSTVKIVNDAVTQAKIADDAVGADQLASNAVVTASIVDDAVTLAKMASGTDGNLISYDASGNPVAVATGSAGQVLTSAGAGAPPTFATLSAGAYNGWAVKTGTYTASNKDQLIANNGSAFTITLPAGSAGNTVIIANAGAGTVTVGRNGSQKINSVAADGTLPQGNSVQLVYVDDTIGWFEI
tara:strand:+ start:3496 stop:4827 length:1332 start_codon:yes stop_codon:yes gene_type:complete